MGWCIKPPVTFALQPDQISSSPYAPSASVYIADYGGV